jgi:membrane-associated phospholipid phosphatase
VNAVDDAFRTGFRRPDGRPASVTSGVLAFGLAPAAAGGLTALAAAVDRRGDEIATDLVLVAEGTLAGSLVAAIAAPIALRERPDVHAIADADAKADALTDASALRSFPSGHVTLAFGLAGASGTVASMRGYRLAPLVWAAGLMLGLATAYARIAADASYFSDTLGGAAIGLGFGAGVPLLLHGPKARRFANGAVFRALSSASVSTTPLVGGRAFGVRWSW